MSRLQQKFTKHTNKKTKWYKEIKNKEKKKKDIPDVEIIKQILKESCYTYVKGLKIWSKWVQRWEISAEKRKL